MKHLWLLTLAAIAGYGSYRLLAQPHTNSSDNVPQVSDTPSKSKLPKRRGKPYVPHMPGAATNIYENPSWIPDADWHKQRWVTIPELLAEAEEWEALRKAYDPERDGRVAKDGRHMAMDCERVEFLVDGYYYSRMDAWACWKLFHNLDRPDVQRLVDAGEVVILGPDMQIVAHYPNPQPEKDRKFKEWLKQNRR